MFKDMLPKKSKKRPKKSTILCKSLIGPLRTILELKRIISDNFTKIGSKCHKGHSQQL